MEAFQRDYGLTVDGAAGKQTQALLFSEALDPTPEPTATPASVGLLRLQLIASAAADEALIRREADAYVRCLADFQLP